MALIFIKTIQSPICKQCGKVVWTATAPPNAPSKAFCECARPVVGSNKYVFPDLA